MPTHVFNCYNFRSIFEALSHQMEQQSYLKPRAFFVIPLVAGGGRRALAY